MKIKITEQQYKNIIIKEQESRLNEAFNSNAELLEEGWKEVLLGVAMLLGVGLSGPNKSMASNALTDEATMAQIKATLEDEDKTKELAKAFAEKGMKDPNSLMAKNAQKLVDNFNKLANENDLTYKISNKVVNNLESLSGELGVGYALKKADIKTDTIKGQAKTKTVIVKDTIEMSFGNDNTFITGGFTLSSNGVNNIVKTLESIKNANGTIISAKIESSTDAESVPKYRGDGDLTGNIKLATLRTKSIADLLQNVDEDINITHREIPDNGSDVVSAKQFKNAASNPEELEKLRKMTADFRYVKLTLVVEFEQKVEEVTKPEEVVRNYRFELVKVFDVDKGDNGGSSRINKGGLGIRFPHKKVSCTSGKKIKCFTKF